MDIKLLVNPKEMTTLGEDIKKYSLKINNIGSFNEYAFKKATSIIESNTVFSEIKELNLIKDEEVESGYELVVSEEGVSIKAKDSENIMYGLYTLEEILSLDENFIPQLKIKDYPSFTYRGIIEGFYGVPWSFSARKRLMEFGAKLKNNVFIYAPKDDPYHREKWEELYPEEKLDEIKSLAQLGKEVNNTFVWTIAPFFEQRITEENVVEKIVKIKDKFDQLYEAGVRQFGVLGDDVGKLDARIPVKIMNGISLWRKSKGDVKELFYCPASYTLTTFYDPKELNAYEMGFPDDVYLFHTGKNICSKIDGKELEKYLTEDLPLDYEDGRKRKEPIFWLNYPVNDIDLNYRKLYLGPVDILDKEANSLKGIVTNPMQESYASLIAISAVSDYSWNKEKFNAKDNWNLIIDKLLKNVSKEFKTFALNMTNQDDRGIKGLEESKDLYEILKDNKEEGSETFKNVDKLESIKDKFSELIEVCNKLLNYSYDEDIKNDIKPYVLNFKDKLCSASYLISSILWFKKDIKLSESFYKSGKEFLKNSFHHYMNVSPKGDKVLHAESATLIFNPWLKNLEYYADSLFNPEGKLVKETLFYSGLDDAKEYRIPLLFKTNKDTILAICDKRYFGLEDYGKVDLVLRRKEKNYEFSEVKTAISLSSDSNNKLHPFTIDASIVQDEESNRIYIFTTMFPASKGFYDAQMGSGYIEIQGEKYLELFGKNGEQFYVKDGEVYTIDGVKTCYKVELIDDEPFRQYGNIYQGDMIIGNIFSENAQLKVKKTSYLMSLYSDDDGLTWHKLTDLNKFVKSEDMKFLGVCPSKGAYLNSGKIVIPVYFTNKYNKQSSCLMTSTDKGESFKLSAITNDGRIISDESDTSDKSDEKELYKNKVLDYKSDFNERYQCGESSLVKHENGDLRLIIRNISTGLPSSFQTVVSKDNGVSFSGLIKSLPFKAQSWCQNGSLLIKREGKEYLLISSPSSYGSFMRLDGKITVLEVKGEELIFINQVDIDRFSFGYSSLIKVSDEKIGVLYEKGASAMHNKVEIIYKEIEIDSLFKKDELIPIRYDIYPIPKKIKYHADKLTLDGVTGLNINLSDAFKYDEAINEKVVEIEKEFINKENISKENLEVSKTKQIKLILKQIEKEHLGEESQLEEKIDYYKLKIAEEIVIESYTLNGAYYGLTTLLEILRQSKDYVIHLDIEDYASSKIRGIIEGYYGIPWGNEKRKALMDFTSKYKGNVFVFAPKDDPYHREKWRELYPISELEQISELANFGRKIKVSYVWTISPFKKDSLPINEENVKEGIECLINKFEQLYEYGVRQFGVLGDDVGALPRDVVVEVMNSVSKWVKKKGDVLDLIFVPEGYVLASWGFKPDELDKYSSLFPDNIHIIFTGENTCAPLTQGAIDGFKFRETKIKERRDPLFWLNWPVNDIDRTTHRRVFLGKASMLEAGSKNFVGVLVNPLEEAYSSMIATFQVLDFAWNSEDFNADSSWKASFKAIDDKNKNELAEIAKHMSNSDNGGIEGLEESMEIGELNEKIESSINEEGTYIYFYLKELQQTYERLISSIDKFLEEGTLIELKNELEPYIVNLRFKAMAALTLIEGITLYKENNELYKELLQMAQEYIDKSLERKIYTRTLEFPAKELTAQAGMHNIDRNIKFMQDYLMKKNPR